MMKNIAIFVSPEFFNLSNQVPLKLSKNITGVIFKWTFHTPEKKFSVYANRGNEEYDETPQEFNVEDEKNIFRTR